MKRLCVALGVSAIFLSTFASAANVTLDLADDDSNESTNLSEIATTGDTNSVFTEPTADKLLIDASQNWPAADTADALSANPAAATSGSCITDIAADGSVEGEVDVWTEAENTAAGYISSESDPNALLSAGTDNVKDSHVDWGTGAGQVSQDDVVDGSTYKQYNPASVAVTGGSIDGVSIGGTTPATSVKVDNITIDGSTISVPANTIMQLTTSGTGYVNAPILDSQDFVWDGIGRVDGTAITIGAQNPIASIAVDDISIDGSTISVPANTIMQLTTSGTGYVNAPIFDSQDFVLSGTGRIDGSTVTIGTTSAIDEIKVDNLGLNGNTISSTDTNGDINLTPNGTGSIVLGGDLSSTSNFETSGSVSGELPVTTTTAATLALTASECRGDVHFNGDDDVIDYTLPAAETGLNCCFHAMGNSQVITVDAYSTSDVINLDGTGLSAGNAIDSAGGAGDHICLTAESNTWYTFSRSGTWVDGGAD